MKKWWLNFWYHYKLRAILGVFFAVIIAVSIWQFATGERYDYKVYLYLSQGTTSEVDLSVKQAVEKYGVDIDDNGNVSVNIIDLSYNPYETDGERKMSIASTLAAEINNCENFVFITDEYRFDELDGLKIFEKQSFLKDNDSKAMVLKGTAFENDIKDAFTQNGLSEQKLPEMMISLKANPGKDTKHFESYKRDFALIENIANKGK